MKKLLVIISLLTMSLCTFGQSIETELVSTSGNSNNSANYKLDWSLGESIIETHQSNSFVLKVKVFIK